MILSVGNTPISVNGNLLSKGPVLPPFTIKLKFTEGVTPTFPMGTGVQVSSSPNIWDLTYENTFWGSLLHNQPDLIEVIGANITGVTNMKYIFSYCTSLTNVSLFDTSNVTNIDGMFRGCTSLPSVPLFDTSNVTSMLQTFESCSSLTTVPLFNTSNVTNMVQMFYMCRAVQSGALALYQQASTQANVPEHSQTFFNCGIDNIDGFYEWEQIPSDWK